MSNFVESNCLEFFETNLIMIGSNFDPAVCNTLIFTAFLFKTKINNLNHRHHQLPANTMICENPITRLIH